MILLWDILKTILEIAVLWFTYYQILVFFEGTRAFQVFRGLAYLLLAFLISEILGFTTINWLLTRFFAISVVAFMIIFQQELRQGLAHLGQRHLFSLGMEESVLMEVIEELASAAFKLSKKKIGGLIAIERETKLKTYIESGILLHAKVSSELIQAYQQMIDKAHAKGILVYGATILPFAKSFYDTPERQAARDKVNEWIRNSGRFDAVIDFDKIMRNPYNVITILPDMHDGDFLHPNEAGYKRMGEGVDLKLFSPDL